MKYFSGWLINFFCLIAVLTAVGFQARAQTASDVSQTEYYGKLSAELMPDTAELHAILFETAEDAALKKFVQPFQSGTKITFGKLIDPRDYKQKIEVFLVEPSKGNPSVCSDLDADGSIAKSECFLMNTAANNPQHFEVNLPLPFKSKNYKNLPVYLLFKSDFRNPNLKDGARVIEQSTAALAFGKVKIDRRELLVGYGFNISDQSINPTTGLFVADVNGDGKFDNFPFSAESAYAAKQEAIFRVGDLYLSTERLDAANGQIVIRPRLKSEYQRQEFAVGKLVEDFSFVDFDNKKRTLADFRGKYLLVDFWGAWCVDCRREVPFQVAAYQRFRKRGLEILGMDTDEEIEKAKTYLAQNTMNWTQARYESIKNLIENTYGIQQYPSTFLLAPDGKILVLDQEKLKGNDLLRTLDEILPK